MNRSEFLAENARRGQRLKTAEIARAQVAHLPNGSPTRQNFLHLAICIEEELAGFHRHPKAMAEKDRIQAIIHAAKNGRTPRDDREDFGEMPWQRKK